MLIFLKYINEFENEALYLYMDLIKFSLKPVQTRRVKRPAIMIQYSENFEVRTCGF